MKSKGRQWIEKEYLPNLKGSVLLVGVSESLMHYPDLVQNPDQCITCDIDPDKSQYGSGRIHIIADFLYIGNHRKVDHICLYGLDPKYTPADEESWIDWAKKLLLHADEHLNDGGTILFGGYMGKSWQSLKLLEEFKDYDELYYHAEFINGKDCIQWWVKKNG